MEADRAVAALADQQFGVVRHAQLLEAGLTRRAIERRRHRGFLRVLHKGVYAVGHLALTGEARDLAAVFASGPHAVLAAGSAAARWGMVRASDDKAPVDVMVIGRNCRAREGIRIHRVTGLDPDDVMSRDGIPVTSPARTLIDLAPTMSPRQLERAFDEGRSKGIVGPRALVAAIVRYPHRRGAVLVADLAAAASRTTKTTITRSRPEEVFFAAVRRARLPIPECNLRVGRWSVDFYWRAQGVVVELDGYEFHSSRWAFKRDRAKGSRPARA